LKINVPQQTGEANIDLVSPDAGTEALTNVRTKMEEEAGLMASIAGTVGGIGANMFAQLGAGFRSGGLNAAALLQAAFGAVLSSIGSALIGQGIAEIVMGHAPPPFGPRPDLVTHGGIMTAIGAGLSIGGGFIGAGASGGGSTNAGIAESPFNPVNVQASTVDIGGSSGSQAVAAQSSEGGVYGHLVKLVTTLDQRISSMPAKSVLTTASRQNRRLVPGLAFGEVPA
jgi:hypothetical protein